VRLISCHLGNELAPECTREARDIVRIFDRLDKAAAAADDLRRIVLEQTLVSGKGLGHAKDRHAVDDDPAGNNRVADLRERHHPVANNDRLVIVAVARYIDDGALGPVRSLVQIVGAIAQPRCRCCC